MPNIDMVADYDCPQKYTPKERQKDGHGPGVFNKTVYFCGNRRGF